ncbi:MAG: DedA family protein, partial [Sandaracinus sp.]|nr:DedA family protein [Sandaracinus sp.]
ERRPVRVVALLRLILWMAPPLNYALAMSAVRFRDYVVGSALGLILPIAAAALFFDWVVATFLS